MSELTGRGSRLLYKRVIQPSAYQTEAKEKIRTLEDFDSICGARYPQPQESISTYYCATVFGRVALTEDIVELIRCEQYFEAMYDSSVEPSSST